MSDAETPVAPDDDTGGDPDLQAFEAVCDTLERFQAETDPCWADGFLTAVAASRRRIETAQWLPPMCGDAFERAFADPPAAAQATQALERWLERRREELEPERLLDRPDEAFVTPLFDVWTDEARAELRAVGELDADAIDSLQDGYLWAGGFLSAVEVFADDWPDPDEDDDGVVAEGYRTMLQLFGALTASPRDENVHRFFAEQWKGAPPTRQELLDEACWAVQDLRVYWLDHGPKPEQRRVGAQPGRNDPCPCGSGRKYKKCHGAAA